jgi:hypothetical protein
MLSLSHRKILKWNRAAQYGCSSKRIAINENFELTAIYSGQLNTNMEQEISFTEIYPNSNVAERLLNYNAPHTVDKHNHTNK